MQDAALDSAAIAADAVALAELHGGTGLEAVRIDWLQRRLAEAPGNRYVNEAGNLVWTFGPAPYRLAVLVHVDDVFDEATTRGVTQRDGWLYPVPSNCALSWRKSWSSLRAPRGTDPAHRKPIGNRGTKSAANRQGLYRVAPRRPGGVDRR